MRIDDRTLATGRVLITRRQQDLNETYYEDTFATVWEGYLITQKVRLVMIFDSQRREIRPVPV